MATTGEGLSDEAFQQKFGGTGQTGEREFLSRGDLNIEIEGQKVFLGDEFRAAEKAGSFTNLDPEARATAFARQRLDLDIGDAARGATSVDLSSVPLKGDLAELSKNLGISQQGIIEARRGQAGGITGAEGVLGGGEQRAFNLRSALPTTGSPVGTSGQFFDEQEGVEVFAAAGEHFQLFAGGGVKSVKGAAPEGSTGAPASSLFTQATAGGKAVQGFKKENLAITPAEGKTIKRTGGSGKNPKTGVDVNVGEDEIFIEYEDGTFEIRSFSDIQAAGAIKSLEEFGPTAEELGITRRTEIKGGAGKEVTRAPFSAAEALARAETPEAKDAVIVQEGGKSTSELELIGKTYRDRVARDGFLFYQDPITNEILERPEELQGLAQPSTSPSVIQERSNIPSMFQSVFGRKPNEDELRYWQGRTDKSGSALIGAMQFAKGKGESKGAAAQTKDPVENMKLGANTGQERLAQIFKEQGITTKSSESKIRKAELDAAKIPEAASVLEFTQEQLEATQFQEAQADLNRSKNALRQLDAGFQSTVIDAERLPGLSMVQIRRNQTELEIAYNRARADLVAELHANSDIVQSQTAVMGMMIDAFKFDTQQAQIEYQNRFNKAMALYEITAQEERDAFNVQQSLVNNQRANLGVIMGMVQDGSLDYNQLSGDERAQISRMEQTVGLQGVTQAIANTDIPPVVSMGANITAADGTVYTPIISQDPRTGEISISHYTHPFKVRIPSSGSGATTLQKNIELAKQYGIDPINVVESQFGLPLTTIGTSKAVQGPLQLGEVRRFVDSRIPIEQQIDPANFITLGKGRYNVLTGQYIPAPDSDGGDVY